MKKTITGLALVLSAGFLAGCGEDLPGGGVCPGLECKSIASAGGSITGIAEMDAFFSSVVNFNAQANILRADVEGTLGRLAAAAGADVGANIDVTAANIAAEIDGGFGGKIDGGIKINFEPPRCEVSAEATIQAAAKCDAEVTPGSAKVECKGTCEAEAKAMAKCSGSAELKCTGTAPSFECTGECKGECSISGGAVCEGTCKGTCELDGSAACDGECVAGAGEDGNCTGECKVRAGGTCSGTCKGTCELNVAAKCDGECRGECTYTAPEGGCTGGAEASCSASGSASVECSGECKGEVVPPKVKAECEASVQAEANFEAECHPPSIGLDYQLSAELQGDANAEARLEFLAQMEAFGKAYAELAATGAKLNLVVDAGKGLSAAAQNAIEGGLESAADGDGSFVVKFQAACAVKELPAAVKLVTDGLEKVEGSVSAMGTITTAVSS